MANPVLANLEAAVNRATTVQASATTLINGISARFSAAIEAALANGATESQLAPFQVEVDELNAAADALSAAVEANT